MDLATSCLDVSFYKWAKNVMDVALTSYSNHEKFS